MSDLWKLQGEADGKTPRLGDVGCAGVELASLLRRGLPVAPTWVVPARVHRRVIRDELPGRLDLQALLRTAGSRDGALRIASGRSRMQATALPAELEAALRGLGDGPFCVQLSPALARNVARRVGLEHAVVVEDAADLPEAVRDGWAACFQEAPLRLLRDQRARDCSAAVLVQRLQGVERAGTLCLTPLPALGVVTLSEGLASAVGAREGARELLRFSSEGTPLEVSAAASSPLHDAPLRQRLVQAAEAIQQDGHDAWVAFGLGPDDQLQITRTGRLALTGGDETVWGRLWLDDLASEVATPLSQSFLERAVVHLAWKLLRRRPRRRRPLVRAFDGRAYLNLSELVPPLASRVRLGADEVVGLASGDAAEVLDEQSGVRARSLLRIPVSAAYGALEAARLTATVATFDRRRREADAWFAELDLAILPDDGLVTTMREVGRSLDTGLALLGEVTAGLIAAQSGLTEVLGRLVPEAGPVLARTIIAGDGRGPRVGAVAMLADITASSTDGVEAFLDRWGHRASLGLELATPRLREQDDLVRQLQQALGGLGSRLEERVVGARVAADAALARVEEAVSLPLFLLVRGFVSRARDFVRLREQVLDRVASAGEQLRTIAFDAERRLRRLGADIPAGSVFFATSPELMASLAASNPDLAPVLLMRRELHLRAWSRPDLPRSFLDAPPTLPSVPERIQTLASAGCPSWGLVEGRVRLVGTDGSGLLDATDDEILVVRRPDLLAGLMLLRVRGLIADRGGRHSPIGALARSLGVPVVLGVTGATAVLRAGERVRLDADRGLVERLDGATG